MNTRNILFAFNGLSSAETALRYSAHTTRAKGAHMTALVAHSGHETDDSHAAWMPAKACEIIAAAKAEIIDDIRGKFDVLSGDLGLDDRLHYTDVTGALSSLH
ncbi:MULTISPECIES: hypothetical protein [unclassified Meridianimarinicoccus]|uniref:hypothetical protein n=1 Tax=unclassified Meridianimarinicoccus TaxID=2923344 RepID=UPI001867FC70|nr:hypothetical protein [Fluviibacterium sp. MJW13]